MRHKTRGSWKNQEARRHDVKNRTSFTLLGQGTMRELNWWEFILSGNFKELCYLTLILMWYSSLHWHYFPVSPFVFSKYLNIFMRGIFRKWRKKKLSGMVQINPASWTDGHSQELATGRQAVSARRRWPPVCQKMLWALNRI